MNSSKVRKACSNCYQKKVRCDWQEGALRCKFCEDHDLECSFPGVAKPPQRTAIRASLQDIEARLQRLEGSSLPGSRQPESQSPLEAPPQSLDVSEASGNSSNIDRLPENTHCSSPAKVTVFRGHSSPWNILADGIAVSDAESFTKTVAGITDDEKRITFKSSTIRFDLLHEYPGLTADLVLLYSSHYAGEAPFPILFWPNFSASIRQGVSTKRWSRWGKIVCVLLYMSFGAARVGTTERRREHELYFKKAWSLIHHLLLEQDLWALKALTLMVHYLQGGSLPEPCYALLGTASRVGINLGFHLDARHEDLSQLEEEEGRRAWWLCCIMEKTFSGVLGRPSFNVDSSVQPPRPFWDIVDEVEDQNDNEAVLLFSDLITLMHTREQVLNEAATPATLRNELLASYTNQVNSSLQLYPLSSQFATLRTTIISLSYNNSLLLLSHHLYPFPHPIPASTLLAAQTTITLITETHTAGLTMCLWMWLYYAFTACVMLFLSILQNPLHADVPLHLALIADIENICGSLADDNCGAKRVMECTREMGRIAVEVMKSRAKQVKRKENFPENDSPQNLKRTETERFSAGEPLADVDWESQDWDLPANFAWDEWVQFLAESVPAEQ